MASIHIIYDPHDRVESNQEMEKALGLKVAKLSISEDLTPNEIKTYGNSLANMLMEQLYIDKGKP
jgi:hypothetical protein